MEIEQYALSPKDVEKLNRELAELLKMCWHEWDGNSFGGLCIKCHMAFGTCNEKHSPNFHPISRPANPDFTTPDGSALLKEKLIDMGEWEGFVLKIGMPILEGESIIKFAEILTTPLLFAQEALSYLKGGE